MKCSPKCAAWITLAELCAPLPAAGPAYNPAANLLKVAPAEVARQAQAVLGYGSDLREPLDSVWLDARQEIHDFAHYMPSRVLELGQRADPYAYPAGQAAAIHEQVRHGRLHQLHPCCMDLPHFRLCCCVLRWGAACV